MSSRQDQLPEGDELPKGWEVKRLGEVCKVIAGQSPQSKFYNSEGKGLPFYQGKKEYGKKYIGEPTTWTTKTTKEAEKGDILLSVRAPVGPINLATQKICIGRGLAAIRSGQQIDNEFLYNFLKKHESEIEGSSGAVFNSINKKQIENIHIPLPPLPEQQRIVFILDRVFAAIDRAKANAEKNLQNARELFESYLQGVFDPSTRSELKESDEWNEKALDEISTIRPNKRLVKEKLKGSDLVSFVPMKYLSEKKLYFNSDLEKALNEVYDGYVYFEEGDVILAKITPCFENGKLGIAHNLKNKVGFGSSEYIVYRVNEDLILPEFLYFYLNRDAFRAKGALMMSGAVGHKRIQPSFYKKVIVSFPSICKQKEIINTLQSLNVETQKLETLYHKKIDVLEELKKSILQKAFRGELETEKGLAV